MTKLFYFLLVFNLFGVSLFSQQTVDSLSVKKTFTNWKGNLEQVDDVCVALIRF